MEGPAGPALRLLTFTTLYPNGARPNHGVFVENRLRHLVAFGGCTSTVLAPVPFFPSGHRMFGSWAQYHGVPAAEQRHGLTVLHPRYLAIPRVGATAAPLLLYAAARRAALRLQRSGMQFDAIDAHYLYPDGVAAVALGRAMGLPVVVTARGSDVTELPDYAGPRRWIRWAVARADALIGVSAALTERLLSLGAAPDRVTALRNGVDLEQFKPAPDRQAARAALRLRGPTLLSVGHLIPRKGHDRVVAALSRLPASHALLIAGEGPEKAALEAQARSLGLSDRVTFLGAVPHQDLSAIYTAADVLVLASSREGWANVLLEAMACGTPVVASPIPGNTEVVLSDAAGLLAGENTAEGLAAAVATLLGNPPDRAATRAYAERFGWDDTSAGQLRVFQSVLGRGGARGVIAGHEGRG